VERLIGTLRRECLDHVIVWNERSVRRTLKLFLDCYHEWRTHLSLDKDAPIPRAVQPPDRTTGRLTGHRPLVHQCVRGDANSRLRTLTPRVGEPLIAGRRRLIKGGSKSGQPFVLGNMVSLEHDVTVERRPNAA